MSDIAYGQRAPDDTHHEFSVLAFLMRIFASKVRTAMPVQVLACTNTGTVAGIGYVDCQPLINQVDGFGNPEPHAAIYNLPYCRLQGGANAIICDPEAGDIGIAVFADRDISRMKNTKAQANPGSGRQHDISDGMYIGGILNGVPQQFLQFQTGIGITIEDVFANKIVTSTSGIVIRDKFGNQITMNSSGIRLADVNGNTLVMDAAGIHEN